MTVKATIITKFWAPMAECAPRHAWPFLTSLCKRLGLCGEAMRVTIAPKASAVMALCCPNQPLDADSCLSLSEQTSAEGLKMAS